MAKTMPPSPFAPATLPRLDPIAGVHFSTAEAGIRYQGRTDLMVAVLAEDTAVAGVFTQSKTASAPVLTCRKHLKKGEARVLVVNSGNANAFTGKKGKEAVEITVDAAAKAGDCARHEVFVASTGVIGEPLEAEKFAHLLEGLVKDAAPDAFEAAARAIMTTDTYPKMATRKALIGDVEVTLNGFCKGAGMIAPDMNLGRSLLSQAEKLKEAKDGKSSAESDLKAYFNDIGAYLIEIGSAKTKGDAIAHQVLNARYHEQEAGIIAQAGVPGAVTIATNMAGRGTDIQLGGNAEYQVRDWVAEETAAGRTPSEDEIAKKRAEILAAIEGRKKTALEAGGLYVIGTERHESRRIDNQLRGRSGRQGDPGRSKFYLALDDDLMRIFGSDRMDSVLKTLGLQEGEAITHPWMNKSLEMAQKKVEARNFDIRKQILKYDDVMNDQRKVIFDQRKDIMAEDDVSETVKDLRHQVVNDLVSRFIPERAYAEQWNMTELKEAMLAIFGLDLPLQEWGAEEGIADQEILERLIAAVDEKAAKKAADIGPPTYRQIEKMVLLQTLDHLWREHLVTLEHLRQVIGFRAYGQRDPLNEYKSEAFVLFESMLARLREATTGQLMHVELAPPGEANPELEERELPEMHAHHLDPTTGVDEMSEELAMVDAAIAARGRGSRTPEKRAPLQTRKAAGAVDPSEPATWGKISRNAPCPCGSGKKYKHCHGKYE